MLLRYLEPAPGELLTRAEALAAEIEAEFLWECAGDGEFAFADFADDYFGGAGVKATTVEGMGAIGRREGIAAQAVATVERS